MNEQTAERTELLQNMTLEELLAKAKTDNHPWLPAIGIFQDDAVYEGWQRAIQEYRQSVDEDAEGPRA